MFNNAIDMRYKALKCELKDLKKNSEDYNKIHDFVINSQVKSKYLFFTMLFAYQNIYRDIRIVNIYSVKRDTEFQQFTSSLHNQQLMFHGSKIR